MPEPQLPPIHDAYSCNAGNWHYCQGKNATIWSFLKRKKRGLPSSPWPIRSISNFFCRLILFEATWSEVFTFPRSKKRQVQQGRGAGGGPRSKRLQFFQPEVFRAPTTALCIVG
jgi:hypothetical protein